MILPTKCPATTSRWACANHHVLWGWKRDQGLLQRVVLFRAKLRRTANVRVAIDDWTFFYRCRVDAAAATRLHEVLVSSEQVKQQIGTAELSPPDPSGLRVCRLAGGPGLAESGLLIRRLANRRPRKQVPTGSFPYPCETPFEPKKGRLVLYAGSGLSYESGLPTLSTIHERFGVDDPRDGTLTFGDADPTPHHLAASVEDTFSRYVDLHLEAATVAPSRSHIAFATMARSGVISRVLTDNLDNIFSALGMPFTQTRGLNIFNDRFPVTFSPDERQLLVVGVSADRRGVIRQARQQGLEIIIVNPQHPVSPRSQDISYIRPRDTWYKMTAAEFIARVLSVPARPPNARKTTTVSAALD